MVAYKLTAKENAKQRIHTKKEMYNATRSQFFNPDYLMLLKIYTNRNYKYKNNEGGKH